MKENQTVLLLLLETDTLGFFKIGLNNNYIVLRKVLQEVPT